MTEQKEQNPNALQILHRDLSTQSQISMLLAVANSMAQPLSLAARTRNDSKDGEWDVDPAMSEWEIAAENTFIHACERLDSVIKDGRRWGIEYQKRLEALFERSTKMAQQLAEEQAKLYAVTAERETVQKEAVKAALAPHNIFRPTLYQVSDGSWIACLGNPEETQSVILGSGVSPAAALRAFDAVFNGELTEEQQRLVKEIQNESNPLDTDRPNTTRSPERSGPNPPPDFHSSGPEL